MALTIKTFTADKVSTYFLIESDFPLESAELIVKEGDSIDVLPHFMPTGTPNEYEATVPADYSDGVITADLRSSDDTLIISIANLTLGHQYLLNEVILERYDCVLLQQLEGVGQLVLANEGDLARSIYKDVQNKAASCTDAPMLGFSVAGASIWIEDSKYIIK